MSGGETLLFVSPRFLFPVDSGGKIRTTQILRGLKGARFRIRLVSPGNESLAERYRDELQSVCDEFTAWPMPVDGWRRTIERTWFLRDKLPMPIRTDLSRDALRTVAQALIGAPTVAVFDFLHTAVLAPPVLAHPTVLFTHNVEAEIFERHRDVARNPLMRMIWSSQYRKMRDFEQSALGRFDVVVAVSERDARAFELEYGAVNTFVIPTGVDLEHFQYSEPDRDRDIVFCGSMDWLANQEAIQFFMDEIWQGIIRRVPDARMTVVGRAPPPALVEAARRRRLPWTFTGFVDDVRAHVAGAAVSVVPINVGGGTRLKVYESMAMGPAVVSTTVGVEGLPVVSGQHCFIADDPAAFANAVADMLEQPARRREISRRARSYIDANFGFDVAAQAFEKACVRAIELHPARVRDR